MHERILLTGAAGLLGTVLRRELGPKVKFLRSTDIVDIDQVAPNEEFVKADLGNLSVFDKLVEGIDAIIHFGGIVKKDVDFSEIAQVNMLGMQALYEAAVRHKVKRVVYASSIHAVGFYEQNDVLDSRAPCRPDTYYGLAKVFGEALAQYYWDRHGLETVTTRIGSCEEKPSTHRHLKSWLSFSDMVRQVEAALDAARVGHTITFGTSRNAASFWDDRYARHIGYAPQDSADTYRDEIRAVSPRPDPDDPVNRYQGGFWAV